MWKLKFHCQTLLTKFVVESQKLPTFTLPYSSLLVKLQLWFWTKMPKPKSEEAGSLSKYERQNLQRLYTQGGAAYVSVRNLVESSNPSVSKPRQFLHSKPSYTKFTLATSKLKRMKAFARFKKEVWCMDLAYVDKLAKDNNGVKCFLVRQDLFDRTVEERDENEWFQKTVRGSKTMTTKNNPPLKNWVDRGTKFTGEFTKLCKTEGLQSYSTKSETKISFAESKKWSLKSILYRYMEGIGYTWIHKLTQFVTTLNSRRNCPIDLIPKKLKISNFLSILYSKQLRELKKPNFETGDRIRFSKYELPFRKCYWPQFTQEIFEIVAVSSRKTPTYAIKNEQAEIIHGKLYQKDLIKLI